MADNVTIDNNRLDDYTIETEQQSGGEHRQIVNIANQLIPNNFDYIGITYVAAGNGAGEIETVTYKTGGAGGTTIATITITYNGDDNMETITRT